MGDLIENRRSKREEEGHGDGMFLTFRGLMGQAPGPDTLNHCQPRGRSLDLAE